MFAFNFVFWIFGALFMGIGAYAAIENWKQGQGKYISLCSLVGGGDKILGPTATFN